jgi:hypothetical protein
MRRRDGIETLTVQLPDIGAVEQQLALLGAHLAANQAQHGRLATTGCTHQRRDLAARNRQDDVIQDRAFAVPKLRLRHSTMKADRDSVMRVARQGKWALAAMRKAESYGVYPDRV